MPRSFGEVFDAIESLVNEGRASTSALDKLVHPTAAPPAPPAKDPDSAGYEYHTPAPPAPPSPPSDAWPWVPHVKWTVFGNEADEKSGEWSQLAYKRFTPTPGSGERDAFVAVPFATRDGDAVDMRLTPTSPIVVGPAGDVGPQNTRDRYLPVGVRPAAETGFKEDGTKSNLAGLDLTPAMAARLTGGDPHELWLHGASGYVDVRWRPSETSKNQLLGARLANEAVALVGHPFQYAPGTEDGELGCADVVSVALIHAGLIAENELQLSVAGLVSLLMTRHGWTAVAGAAVEWSTLARGDVIQWDPRQGQEHGHVGIYVGDGMCVNNSSSQKAVINMPLTGYDRPVVRVIRVPGVV